MSAFFGSLRIRTSDFFVESFQRDSHRQASHQLRNQPVTKEIVRLDFAEHLGLSELLVAGSGSVEPDLTAAGAGLDDLLQAVERAAADEEDVLRIELDVLLLRVLAAALRRYRSDRALDDLEQRLLHAFARHVARDARILRLPRDLVDLVDVDDSALALGDVEVTCLQQTDENVLDVFTDVSGFGERRRIGDREWNVEDSGERASQQRLTDAGGTDEQNVGFVELYVVFLERRGIDALVVVVYRNGESFLGLLLPNDILIENVFDFLRRWYLSYRLGYLALLILRQNLVAESNALVADVNGRSGNELPDRILRFAAEGATEVFLLGHRFEGNE